MFYKRGDADRDATRIEEARRAIVAHYDRLERTVPDGGHLCGDFSVADIGYFMTITFATNLGGALGDGHPRLQAWYARLLERPSIRKEVQGLLQTSTA